MNTHVAARRAHSGRFPKPQDPTCSGPGVPSETRSNTGQEPLLQVRRELVARRAGGPTGPRSAVGDKEELRGGHAP